MLPPTIVVGLAGTGAPNGETTGPPGCVTGLIERAGPVGIDAECMFPDVGPIGMLLDMGAAASCLPTDCPLPRLPGGDNTGPGSAAVLLPAMAAFEPVDITGMTAWS
jgi:hypothetical protein